MIRYLLSSVFIMIATGCGDGQTTVSSNIPVYRVVRTEKPPVVDGVMTEECWQDINPEIFLNNIDGGKVTPSTTVRLIYDELCLYIGFECQDTNASGVRGSRDSEVREGDHVTVCLDPGGEGLISFCIEVSPEGTVADAVVLFKRDGSDSQILYDWNMPSLRSSATVYKSGVESVDNDRFWTVEMAIPFDELYGFPAPNPGSGTSWRAGLYRVDYNDAVTYSALAPTGEPVLIRPSAYAVLAFGE